MKIMKGTLVMLCLALVFIGCDDDDGSVGVTPANLTLNFSALYSGQPLVLNQVVDFNGQAMRIVTSEFYVSDIQLTGSGNSFSSSTTNYVKFDVGNGMAPSLKIGDVPAGTYSELHFFIGVPADKNAMKPEDFTSDQALSQSSTYWIGWQSYIFSKLEGLLDTSGDGETDLPFIYHSGKDELYTEVSISLTNGLTVVDGQELAIDLLLEHKDLFKDGNSYLDIEAKPTAHDANDLTYPTIILANFKNGIVQN